MSSKYTYLDIAISVLGQDGQPVNYSFNSAPTIALPSLTDLARHFVNISEGYVMWYVGGRRAYTYFKLNQDGTAAELALTVRLEPDVLMAGRPIINLLGNIRRTLTDGSRLTHEVLMRSISDSGFPETPLRSELLHEDNPDAVGLCCRTFISSTELANILAFPRQDAYVPYQGVIVVSATVSMQAESAIPLITDAVDKALMVVCPEEGGVTASAGCVKLSDHLTLTYEKAGFNPQSVEFEVGTTNRYVRINGPALIVNSARHAGIVFNTTVPYTVMSAAGNPIDTYTILINGRTATRGDGEFEVTDADFADGRVTIAVSSTNYGSYSREFTPEELRAEAPLQIVLEPEARKIVLRLDFGGGRVIEDAVVLEKSTPEYNRLRAGSFHGFRAHRLVGTNPETYNVDVRQQAPVQQALNFEAPQQPAAAPVPMVDAPKHTPAPADVPAVEVAPAKTPAAAPQRRPGAPVPPAIEKAPSAVWENPSHHRVAPKFENVSGTSSPHGGGTPSIAGTGSRVADKLRAPRMPKATEDTVEKGSTKRRDDGDRKPFLDIRFVVYGVAVVAAALIVWWLVLLLSGPSTPEENTADVTGEAIEDVTYDSINDPVVTANATNTPEPKPGENQGATAATVPAAANDAETADIAYLNENTTWRLEDMKSDKYRALITAMQAGNIDAVASNPYFATPGTATNKKANQVINYLWAAKGSIQEKKNVEKLRDLTKADKANLGELIDVLSRMQPSDANTAPRPGE